MNELQVVCRSTTGSLCTFSSTCSIVVVWLLMNPQFVCLDQQLNPKVSSTKQAMFDFFLLIDVKHLPKKQRIFLVPTSVLEMFLRRVTLCCEVSVHISLTPITSLEKTMTLPAGVPLVKKGTMGHHVCGHRGATSVQHEFAVWCQHDAHLLSVTHSHRAPWCLHERGNMKFTSEWASR